MATKRTRNFEAEPTHLPGSGRWRVYVWDSVARGKRWVKNPEPGSRGTWETKGRGDLAAPLHPGQVRGGDAARRSVRKLPRTLVRRPVS
jgi:hypothetical protein